MPSDQGKETEVINKGSNSRFIPFQARRVKVKRIKHYHVMPVGLAEDGSDVIFGRVCIDEGDACSECLGKSGLLQSVTRRFHPM